MASKDPILDRLMMMVIAVGVVIVGLAVYAIATEPDVIVQLADEQDRPTTVEVVMSEFAFAPARFDVESGETYEFEVHNRGAVEHEFRLTTQSSVEGHIEDGHADHDDETVSDDRFVLVAAGESATMTVTFDETATFDLVACLLPGHFESGMVAPLGGLAQPVDGDSDNHDDEVPHNENDATHDDEDTGRISDGAHDEEDPEHAEEPAESHDDVAVTDEAATDADLDSTADDERAGNEDADEADVAPEDEEGGHDDDGHTH